MQDAFDQKKAYILQEIASDVTDASPKGTIDEPCWPIIQTINSHPDMVTTSSCSGRVSVFLEGVKQSETVNRSIGAKGHEGKWLFVTHDPSELSEWYKPLKFEYTSSGFQTGASTRYILFKFEPLILHVKCRNTQMANRVYQAAMACGFRESGIGTNDIVGIRISIKLNIPIGYLDDQTLKIMVTEEYLQLVTKLAEDRFAENFRKLGQLERSMESLCTSGSAEASSSHTETKEERRERKRKEGLERQRLKRENDDKKLNSSNIEQIDQMNSEDQ